MKKRAPKRKPKKPRRVVRFRLTVDYQGAPSGEEPWSERAWVGERVSKALDAEKIIRMEIKAL